MINYKELFKIPELSEHIDAQAHQLEQDFENHRAEIVLEHGGSKNDIEEELTDMILENCQLLSELQIEIVNRSLPKAQKTLKKLQDKEKTNARIERAEDGPIRQDW